MIEKGVECALLQLETNNTGDGRFLKEYKIPEPFILALLSKLKWIFECCYIASNVLTTLYALHQHLPNMGLLEWLAAKCNLSPEVEKLIVEQEKVRAIETLKEVALEYGNKFQEDWRMILDKEQTEKPSRRLSYDSVLSLFTKL